VGGALQLQKMSSDNKDVIFLETAMGFAQQHHHCLVDCIPFPHVIVKEASVYFKKVSLWCFLRSISDHDWAFC